jgi:hypothetical protein
LGVLVWVDDKGIWVITIAWVVDSGVAETTDLAVGGLITLRTVVGVVFGDVKKTTRVARTQMSEARAGVEEQVGERPLGDIGAKVALSEALDGKHIIEIGLGAMRAEVGCFVTAAAAVDNDTKLLSVIISIEFIIAEPAQLKAAGYVNDRIGGGGGSGCCCYFITILGGGNDEEWPLFFIIINGTFEFVIVVVVVVVVVVATFVVVDNNILLHSLGRRFTVATTVFSDRGRGR